MRYKLCLFLVGALVVSSLSAGLQAQKPMAIQNATILTGTGERIENGSIVIVDGKIADVGKDIKIPVAAKIIDAAGRVVMPGLVEAHTAEGLSQANETNPNVPYVTVIDGIDPMNSYFSEARRNGITSVRIAPGNSTMIGGQAAVIKTGGEFIDDMVLDGFGGVKISLRPVSGSRMSHLANLRKALDEAKEKLEKKSKSEAKDDAKGDDAKGDKPSGDSDKETEKPQADAPQAAADKGEPKVGSPEAESELDKAMNALLTGKYAAIIYCEKAMDVGQALRLIKDYQLKASLVLGQECYKAVDQVAESGLPVILDSTLVYWEEDPRTKQETKIVLPKIFSDAGVKFVFQTDRAGSMTVGTNYLWYQAATAMKYGMSQEDAIASLTMLPAKFLNVDKFVGSIEKGKDADLVILSGEPLGIDTWVDTTIVNGEVVYEKKDDDQLRRLLSGEEKDAESN